MVVSEKPNLYRDVFHVMEEMRCDWPLTFEWYCMILCLHRKVVVTVVFLLNISERELFDDSHHFALLFLPFFFFSFKSKDSPHG